MDTNFEHVRDFVFSNVWGGVLFGFPRPEVMPLPDGSYVQTAAPGQLDTVRHFLMGDDGHMLEINPAQAFAEGIALHFAYGDAIPGLSSPMLQMQNLVPDLHFTIAEVYNAIVSLPHLASAIVNSGYTGAEIIGYIEAQAPGVLIV